MRRVYTLGYDALDLEHLKGLVLNRGIEVVVDVRRWGKGAKMPQYSADNLAREFAGVGVDYVWMPTLGGYRRFGVDVEGVGIGGCFRSEGFRAYATYILTSEEAKRSLERLLEISLRSVAVLLCRERLPYGCHRKILSDWLLYKGFEVVHIVPPREFEHRYTRCARVVGGELTYV